MKKAFLFLSIFLTATFINAQESGETGAIEDALHELVYQPIYDGIIPFDWEMTIPDIEKSNNHPNGFDNLPKSCYETNAPDICYALNDDRVVSGKKIPLVFISIENGKKASLIFKEGKGVLLNKLKKMQPYDELRLLPIQKYDKAKKKLTNIYDSEAATKNDISTNGIDFSDGTKKDKKISIKTLNDSYTKEISFQINNIEDESVYGFFARNKPKKNSTSKQEWTEFLRIHIIPYDPIIKEFVFIQLDGDYSDEFLPPNSITMENTLKTFNEVYKEAVVKAKITIGRDNDNDIIIDENTKPDEIQELKKKKFKPTEFTRVEINMTDSKSSEEMKSAIIKQAIEYLAQYGDVTNNNSKYRHIVFAINQERKKWPLIGCNTPKENIIDLTSCNGFIIPSKPGEETLKQIFKPEQEREYVQYFINRPNDCSKPDGESEKIAVKIKKGDNGHYYALGKDVESLNYKATTGCDVLYTDNGQPIAPSNNGAAGTTSPWNKKRLTNAALRAKKSLFIEDEMDEHLRYKKHIPYGGIIMVPRSQSNEEPYTVVHELGHSFGLTDVAVDRNEYTIQLVSNNVVEYGTTERNIMTWTSPSGPKIRYRDTPIACTGGEKKYTYILDLNSKTGKSCSKGEYCKTYTQEITSEIKVSPYEINNNENQWECIRNCYQEDLISASRVKYWLKGFSSINNKDLKIPKLPTEYNDPNECTVGPTNEYVDLSDLKRKYLLKKGHPEKITLEQIKDYYNPPIQFMQAYFPSKELEKLYSKKELQECINPITNKKCFNISK